MLREMLSLGASVNMYAILGLAALQYYAAGCASVIGHFEPFQNPPGL